MSNKRPKEPAGPSLLVMAARTPRKSEQLEGMPPSGSPTAAGERHTSRETALVLDKRQLDSRGARHKD